MINKIASSQKKIIYRSLITISVFLILWLFIYLPAKKRVRGLQSELSRLESEIKNIESIAGKATMSEGVNSMQQRFQELNNKFPAKEEEAFRLLSNFAKKLNIEFISIKPKPKEIFLDEDDQEIKIEEKTCQIVFVSLRLRSDYENLVKYIEGLKDHLPGFIAIEELNIAKYKFQNTARLEITLDFNLYFLS